MNIKTFSPNQGSALLMSLVLLGLTSAVLASYLALVHQERNSMARSLAWNVVLPVAEAGIEEAQVEVGARGGAAGVELDLPIEAAAREVEGNRIGEQVPYSRFCAGG